MTLLDRLRRLRSTITRAARPDLEVAALADRHLRLIRRTSEIARLLHKAAATHEELAKLCDEAIWDAAKEEAAPAAGEPRPFAETVRPSSG